MLARHTLVWKKTGKKKNPKPPEFVNAQTVIFNYALWTGMEKKEILQELWKCLFYEYFSLNAWYILGDLLKFVYAQTSESKARRGRANLVLWLQHSVNEKGKIASKSHSSVWFNSLNGFYTLNLWGKRKKCEATDLKSVVFGYVNMLSSFLPPAFCICIGLWE